MLQSSTPTTYECPPDVLQRGAKAELQSAEVTLKHVVNDMMTYDKRFAGMSRYIDNIVFYWSEMISTACAGDGFIFFNPFFWDKLVPEERKTVVAHEIWHLILDHKNRGQDLDHDLFNRACDYVINLGLADDSFVVKTPTNFNDIGILYDLRFKHKSAEQIYHILAQEKKENPEKDYSPIPGTPSKDQIEDLIKEALKDVPIDMQTNKELNQELLEDVIKQPRGGTASGATQRLLASRNKQIFILEKPYEDIFDKYLIDPLTAGKRTYGKPSRRQLRGGLRMKGRKAMPARSNRLTHLVYGLDVSGSISTHEGHQFIASAKTLKEQLNPKLMTVILWDTRIVFEKTFSETETLDNIHVRAGGGTNLNPLYGRIKEIKPEAVVIFTDLAVSMPPPPDCDVIWFVPHMNVGTSHVNCGTIYKIPED